MELKLYEALEAEKTELMPLSTEEIEAEAMNIAAMRSEQDKGIKMLCIAS